MRLHDLIWNNQNQTAITTATTTCKEISCESQSLPSFFLSLFDVFRFQFFNFTFFKTLITNFFSNNSNSTDIFSLQTNKLHTHPLLFQTTNITVKIAADMVVLRMLM